MREELLRIINENGNLAIDKYISDNMRLLVPKAKKEELLLCMDIILKNTTNENEWVYNLKFLKIPNFYKIFLDNMHNIDFDKINLPKMLNCFCLAIPYEEVYSDTLIKKIVSLNYKDYNHMYKMLLSVDKKLALNYLAMLLNNEEDIDLIVKLLINSDNEEYIKSSLDLIFSKIKNFFILKKVSSIEKEVSLYFNEHFDTVIDRLIDGSKNEKRRVYEIFNEVTNFENISFSDIDLIGHGNFSSVYAIGSKVLKIGYKRANINNIDCDYALKPILYEVIGDDKKIFVEVQEKVKTFNDDELTDDELYSLYKKIRDNKQIWIDIKRSNVGLKDDDLVIIDNDHIYDENDDNRFNKVKNNLYTEFEIRYQNDKKSVK